MKVLTIGIALPGRAYHNHTLINAPAIFDFDALVIDPTVVSAAIEEVCGAGGEQRTGDGQLVANLSGSPLVMGLDQLLRSRREQVELLLRRGGTVVVVAAPDIAHGGIAGLSSWRRFSWLPETGGRSWDEWIHPAFGRGCSPSDNAHPFGAYAEYGRELVAYRAFFNEGAELKVFARSPGGAAIGVELAADRGRIVFIPALRDPGAGVARARLASILLECLSQLGELQTIEDEPAWALSQPLPGLEQLEAAEAEAAQAREEATNTHEAARASRQRTSDLRRLLWASGPPFEDAVIGALARLGFSVSSEDGALIDHADGVTLVEALSTEDEAGIDCHYRLRRRREEGLASEGRMPGGLLVVNGFREQPVDERPHQVSDSLRIAAESQRYCLVTGVDLLKAASLALGAAKETELKRLREALIACEGLFDGSEFWSGFSGERSVEAGAEASD